MCIRDREGVESGLLLCRRHRRVRVVDAEGLQDLVHLSVEERPAGVVQRLQRGLVGIPEIAQGLGGGVGPGRVARPCVLERGRCELPECLDLRGRELLHGLARRESNGGGGVFLRRRADVRLAVSPDQQAPRGDGEEAEARQRDTLPLRVGGALLGVRSVVGLGHVGARHRQVDDSRQDQAKEDQAGGEGAQRKTGRVARALSDLRGGEPVSDVRPERAGQDVGEPEGQHRVRAEPPQQRDRRDETERQHDRDSRAPAGELQGPVAGRGAERERDENGEPIERLTRQRRDRVDGEGTLAQPPHAEDHGEQDREHGGADPQRYVELVGQDVGVQRARDADNDHGQPVRERDVPLQP